MRGKKAKKNIYKLYAYERTHETLNAYQKKYTKRVEAWEKLRSQGVALSIIKEFVKISRSTYYRSRKVLKQLEQGIVPPSKRPKCLNKPCWGESECQVVLSLRRENPTYGKEKIAIILQRDRILAISESTVGRILKKLFSSGLIQKSASSLRQKRKRNFKKGYAKPWNFKEYDTMVLGERVQFDHMTVTKNGVVAKHFQGWERKSKYLDAGLYTQANSQSAKRFLSDFVENAPFKIKSIQVDGGSEFMDEFEEGCCELNIPLIVLPPAKPKYNGGVERSNRTLREEFYANPGFKADSIRKMRVELKKAIHKYNTFRPHKSLHGLTPMMYLKKNLSETSNLSHII